MPALNLGPYTFDALDETVDLPAPDGGCCYQFQVTGSGTQTLEFQDSFDGTNYAPHVTLNENTQAFALNLASALPSMYRSWQESSSGFVRPRLRTTAFTSGSVEVHVRVVPYRRLHH